MKRFFVTVFAAAMLVAGCSPFDDSLINSRLDGLEDDVEALDRRVTTVEQLCSQLNGNISALQALVDAQAAGLKISSVESVEGGFVVKFDDGSSYTILNGRDGANGADGKDGVDGKDGQDGAQGEKGEKGDKGDKGDQGEKGDTGAAGADGKDGADGQDAAVPVIGIKMDTDGNYYWTLNGEWLLDSTTGEKVPVVGTNGRDGKDGVDGKDGADGKDGQDGAQGEKGDKGDKGDQGDPGIQGEPGQDGAQGEKGDKGDKGDTGAAGADGKDGQDGKDGADGKDGVTPQLKIENGLWYVSLDNGATWTVVEGSPAVQPAISVTEDDEAFHFDLGDGTVIDIPKAGSTQAFSLQVESYAVEIGTGATYELKYKLTGGDATTHILMETAGCLVSVDAAASKVIITGQSSPCDGYILLKAVRNSDGAYSAQYIEVKVVALPSTVADILAGEDGDWVVDEALVVAVGTTNTVITDGTGYMFVYDKNKVCTVGDKASFSGAVTTFNGVKEFNIPEIDLLSEGNSVQHPDPVALNAAAIAAYETAPVVEYVIVKGVKDGYNVMVGDKKVNVYSNDDLTAFEGKDVIVYGYTIGYNSSKSCINLVAVSCEEDTSATHESIITVAETKSVKVGETIALGASVNSGAVLSYSSDDESIATVDASGTVTGVAAGTAVITISAPTSGNYTAATATCTVTVTPASVSGGAKYVKVTSSADLKDGKYLIVYETGNLALNGGLETIDATDNYVSVTITDGEIAQTSSVDAAAFTYTASAGSFLGTNGKYIGHSGSKNTLNTSTTVIENTVSFDSDGNAVIACGSYTLRYNNTSGQNRFRYYASGQQAVQLYKYVAE